IRYFSFSGRYLIPDSTFTVSTALTGQTSLYVHQSIGIVAGRTDLISRFHTVRYVFFKRPGYSVLPGVDVLIVEIESIDKIYHVVDWHIVPEYARNQLGVVPVFLVK